MAMIALLLAAQALPPIVAQPGPALREQMRVEARAQAEKRAEIARLEWVACIQKKKLALRRSRERIGDVVTAVLSGCTVEQSTYQSSLPMRYDYAAQVVSGTREGIREALTGFFVEDRLKTSAR
jgi:hypothetical protein